MTDWATIESEKAKRRCGNPDLFRFFVGCMAWILVMACLAAFALWVLQCP